MTIARVAGRFSVHEVGLEDLVGLMVPAKRGWNGLVRRTDMTGPKRGTAYPGRMSYPSHTGVARLLIHYQRGTYRKGRNPQEGLR